jgi:hypothetical protein
MEKFVEIVPEIASKFFHENFRGIFPGNPIFRGKKCTRNQPQQGPIFRTFFSAEN